MPGNRPAFVNTVFSLCLVNCFMQTLQIFMYVLCYVPSSPMEGDFWWRASVSPPAPFRRVSRPSDRQEQGRFLSGKNGKPQRWPL